MNDKLKVGDTVRVIQLKSRGGIVKLGDTEYVVREVADDGFFIKISEIMAEDRIGRPMDFDASLVRKVKLG